MEHVKTFNYLGLTIDTNLDFKAKIRIVGVPGLGVSISRGTDFELGEDIDGGPP